MGNTPATHHRTLLNRDARRAQILTSAERVFARHGFRDTSLDDIADEAGITRTILYRHFDSKEDLYRGVLDAARSWLRHELGIDQGTGAQTVAGFVQAAAAEPDRFRLLFGKARHEPAFAGYYEEFACASARFVLEALPGSYGPPPVADMVANLVTRHLFETVLVWLDGNQAISPGLLADAIRASSRALVATIGISSGH